MRQIRWLLIVPACIFVWYFAFVLSLFAYDFAGSFCHEEKIISGFCTAAWFRATESILIVLFSGLSAALVVFIAYLVAPSHKNKIAVSALVIGAIVATYMAFQTEVWAGYVAALASGFLSVCWVLRIGRRST